MGLSFAARLMGLAKWLLVIPVVGIPAAKVLKRRGFWEVVQFLREGREEVEMRRLASEDEGTEG